MTTNIDADEIGRARERGVQANGVFIYRARRLQALTQEALASAADCDVKTVRRAESNARLDIGTLVRIANALQAPFQKVVKSQRRHDASQHD